MKRRRRFRPESVLDPDLCAVCGMSTLVHLWPGGKCSGKRELREA